jgi:hypothetical protein
MANSRGELNLRTLMADHQQAHLIKPGYPCQMAYHSIYSAPHRPWG